MFSDTYNKKLNCNCGESHEIPVKAIDIGSGALGRAPETLKSLNITKDVLIISDENTREAAGSILFNELENDGFSVKTLCYKGSPQLRPDETAVEELLSFTEKNQGTLIAVGSGTVNDLVRRAAHLRKRKYISVATAPSMDGYASVISALMENGVKKTFYGEPPLAIIADTDIIAKAPGKMVMAGFGDMLAKIVSIADWRLGVALNGERWCSLAASMSITARDKATENTTGISKADRNGIHALTEALINSGMAIIIAGQTRPASGAEHHFAHYLEMKLALEGKPEILHGIKVGLGTLCSIAMYNALQNFDPDSIVPSVLSQNVPDLNTWQNNMRNVFGRIADEMIAESDATYLNGKVTFERLVRIKNIWHSQIKPIIDDVPQLADITELVRSAGYDFSPQSLNLSAEEMLTALTSSMEVRSRYTVLRLMQDLGMLRLHATKTVEKFFALKSDTEQFQL